MGSIKNTPGKLYFIKERDYLNGEISPYVKIGLVRNEKETEKRILEHQTGNPREIYDHKTLETPFVEHLETLVHYLYADCWITGEWFRMDDAKLAEAISKAEQLVSEQGDYVERIRETDALKSVLDDGSTREASKEEIDLQKRFVEVKLDLDRWNAKGDVCVYRLKEVCGDRLGIAGVCSYTEVKPSKVFNETEFADQYPDIHKHFLVEQIKQNQSFNVKEKKSLKVVDPDLFTLKKELKSSTDEIELKVKEELPVSSAIKELHEEYLIAQMQSRKLEWELTKLEVALKSKIQRAEEIEGVCTWKRKENVSVSLDRSALKAAHPHIYAKFEYEKESSPKFSVNSWRPYAH